VLDAGGRNLKTAIVMAGRRCSAEEANAALARAGGLIRKALEERGP
jgi:N-acetylmuramic acid 6-phosphate (MurNAc-6-P) etherase